MPTRSPADNYKVVRVGGDEDVTVISGIGLETARETASRFNDHDSGAVYWYVAVEEIWHRNPIEVAGGWEPGADGSDGWEPEEVTMLIRLSPNTKGLPNELSQP